MLNAFRVLRGRTCLALAAFKLRYALVVQREASLKSNDPRIEPQKLGHIGEWRWLTKIPNIEPLCLLVPGGTGFELNLPSRRLRSQVA